MFEQLPPDVAGLARVAVYGAAIAIGLVFLYAYVKRFLYICRPSQALIISGRTQRMEDGTEVGFRVIFGGRAWRTPIIERVDRMDMTVMPIEIAVTQAYSKGGIPLAVRAIANVKISSNPAIIVNAVERFLGKDRIELRRVARETLEGTLRGVLATLTPEEVNENRLKFAESLAEDVEGDFEKLGLQLDTLKVQHVSDEVQYLDSIGRARTAMVIKQAEIAESDTQREADNRAADAAARGNIAREDAEQAIVRKRNDQRRIAAEYDARATSELRRATAAGEQARAEAEQALQQVRRELEQLRLQAEVVIPSEMKRQGRELVAKGDAAPIQENGKALATVLQLLAEAWAKAGPSARDIFVIQQLEKVLGTVVARLAALEVREVHIVDPGDGSALPNYLAGFPTTVTAMLRAFGASTGIDVAAVLAGDGAAARKTAPGLATR